MAKRFIVCPGHVRSKTDGQTHYIGVAHLTRLYGVDARDCIVAEPTTWQRDHANDTGIKFVYLRPRHDGDYSLKKTTLEQS